MESENLVKTEHEILVDLLKLSSDFDNIVDDYKFRMPYLNKSSYRDLMFNMHEHDLNAPIVREMSSILAKYESILVNEY